MPRIPTGVFVAVATLVPVLGSAHIVEVGRNRLVGLPRRPGQPVGQPDLLGLVVVVRERTHARGAIIADPRQHLGWRRRGENGFRSVRV